MSDHFFVNAFWGSRSESVAECAQRIQKYLISLRSIDSSFETWYRKGRSRSAAKTSVLSLDLDNLAGSFRWNHRDLDRQPLPELGVGLSGWSGGPDELAAAFRVNCGATHPTVGNSLVLDLPENLDASSEQLINIVRATVDAWSPEIVNVDSTEHLRAVRESGAHASVGWMTYLPIEAAKLPSLPLTSTGSIQPLPDGGTLVMITRERFSSKNAEHRSVADQTGSILRAAGLIAA